VSNTAKSNQSNDLPGGKAMESTSTVEIIQERTGEDLLDINTLTDEQLALVGGGQGMTLL